MVKMAWERDDLSFMFVEPTEPVMKTRRSHEWIPISRLGIDKTITFIIILDTFHADHFYLQQNHNDSRKAQLFVNIPTSLLQWRWQPP